MPAVPLNKPYRVGRSRTGLGLFATKPIRKGAKIINYFGPVLDSEKSLMVPDTYQFAIDDHLAIDGSGRDNIARYINHACKPNAAADVPRWRKEREKKPLNVFQLFARDEMPALSGVVTIRANQDIKAGEEITFHYGFMYFCMFIEPIGCKCLGC